MDLLNTVRKEGSRGGRAEFKWSDVQQSQHRENYLGHSLMAPVGRWQTGKDLNWYAKGDVEGEMTEAEKRKEEIRKVKEVEEEARRVALGLPPKEEANPNLIEVAAKPDPAEVVDKKRHKRHRSRDRERERDGDRHRHRRHRSRSRDAERKQHRRERSSEGDRRRERDERPRVRSRSREYKRRKEHSRERKDDDRRRHVRDNRGENDRKQYAREDRRQWSRSPIKAAYGGKDQRDRERPREDHRRRKSRSSSSRPSD